MPSSLKSRLLECRSLVLARFYGASSTVVIAFLNTFGFLLSDDHDKDPVGTETKERKSGDGDGTDIWDTSTPIFEQLLLSASRSPQRLKAIDDVIEKLLEDDDDCRNIVPQEFLEFWEAFKQIVPRQKRSQR